MKDKSVYRQLDIRSFFNHRLFYGCRAEAKKTSEPGLNGLYINGKMNSLKTSIHSPKGVPFQLSLGIQDNFYCDGQILPINAKTGEIHFLGFSYFGDMIVNAGLHLVSGEDQEIEVHMRECSVDCNNEGWYTVFTPDHTRLERVAKFVTSGRGKQDFYIFDRTCILSKSMDIKELVFGKNIFLHILAITVKVIF